MAVGLEESQEVGQVMHVELEGVFDQWFERDSPGVHPSDQHIQEVLSGLYILVAVLLGQTLEEVHVLGEEGTLLEEGMEEIQGGIMEQKEE